jgi:ribosomal protein L7/L12
MNESRENVGLPPMALEALRKGNKIEAIKIVRVESNIGLKEAKDRVEDYVLHDPVLRQALPKAQAEARRGIMGWLAVLFALGLAAYYLLAK